MSRGHEGSEFRGHGCGIGPVQLRRESDQSVVVTIGELDTLRGKMVEAEDQLSGQVVLLREQLASEQLEKGRLQASLSAQLEAAQKKTGGQCTATVEWHLEL